MKVSKTRKEREDRKSWLKQLKKFWRKLSTKGKIRRGSPHNSKQTKRLLGEKTPSGDSWKAKVKMEHAETAKDTSAHRQATCSSPEIF